MNTNLQNTTYRESLMALCFVICRIEDDVNIFESHMFKFMRATEKITNHEWHSFKLILECQEDFEILDEYLKLLLQCNNKEQLNILAWMNTIANVDGELGDKEWSIIYDIYKNKLNITLEDILTVELPEMDYGNIT